MSSLWSVQRINATAARINLIAASVEKRHPALFEPGSLVGNPAFYCLMAWSMRRNRSLGSGARFGLLHNEFFLDWFREVPVSPREAALGALGCALVEKTDGSGERPLPSLGAVGCLFGLVLVFAGVVGVVATLSPALAKEWTTSPWLAAGLAGISAAMLVSMVRGAPAAVRAVPIQVAAVKAARLFQGAAKGVRPTSADIAGGGAFSWLQGAFMGVIFGVQAAYFAHWSLEWLGVGKEAREFFVAMCIFWGMVHIPAGWGANSAMGEIAEIERALTRWRERETAP